MPACRGFTLVELLVVIAIVAMITVAGSAAFKSMGGGNVRQRSAVNLTVGMVDQARSQALASGGDTYLAFANGDANFEAEQKFRSIAIFRRNPESTDGLPLIQETPWRLLPQGIAFYTSTSATDTPGDVLRSPKKTFTATKGTVSAPYIRFSPQGAIVEPSQPDVTPTSSEVTIYIFQGHYNDGSTATPTRKTDEGKPVLDSLSISRYTGRVKHLSDT